MLYELLHPIVTPLATAIWRPEVVGLDHVAGAAGHDDGVGEGVAVVVVREGGQHGGGVGHDQRVPVGDPVARSA